MVTGAIPSLQRRRNCHHDCAGFHIGANTLYAASRRRTTQQSISANISDPPSPHAFFTSSDTRGSRGNTRSFITVTIAEAQRPWWPTMDLSRSRVALHCTFHGLIMELLRTNVFLETENTEFKKWTNTVWTLAVERCAAVGAHSENDSQNGPLYPACKDGRSSTGLSH